MRCCGMRSSSLLNAFVTRDGAAAVTSDKIAACAVSTTKLADGAVTSAKIRADAEGANQLQEGIPIDMQDQQLTRPELKVSRRPGRRPCQLGQPDARPRDWQRVGGQLDRRHPIANLR
jgi:hypothetical protein